MESVDVVKGRRWERKVRKTKGTRDEEEKKEEREGMGRRGVRE